ncbi:MAG TPA: glycosyl hydrolase family 28-related protein [Thermoanaerobaculia bacterium]|jgi:hypothetical protein
MPDQSIPWVNTVLGAAPVALAPPTAARTAGDLATKDDGTIVPGGASTVVAKGCVTPGDGGGGLFYWDADTATPDDGGTVIVPSIEPRAGCWKRIQDGDALSVKWFGAVGDGSQPNDDAFANAIHALRFPASFGTQGPTIVVPPGIYAFQDTIVIDRQIVLRGSAGGAGFPSTVLRFPSGTGGIRIVRAGDGGVAGDGSLVEGLRIEGARSGSPSCEAPSSAHGITMNARAFVERCSVANFDGDGIHIEAFMPQSNANGWMLRSIRIDAVGGHGVFVHGSDANAGCATAVDVADNAGWGIWDASFLGNTFIACQIANAAAGNYRASLQPDPTDPCKPPISNPNARSLFLNCYSEDGNAQPRSEVGAPSMIIGGFAAGTITNGFVNGGGGVSVDGEGAALTVAPRLKVINFASGTLWARTTLGTEAFGGAGTGRTALEISRNGLGSSIHFSYTDSALDWLSIGRPTDSNLAPLRISSPRDPSEENAFNVWMQNGFLLGGQVTTPNPTPAPAVVEPGIFVGLADGSWPGPPRTLNRGWKVGDRILNTVPSSSVCSPAGWVCVATGSPATFAPFGEVQISSSSAPTAPASVGDKVYNSSPISGDPIGWVCTAGGWKGFGQIA